MWQEPFISDYREAESKREKRETSRASNCTDDADVSTDELEGGVKRSVLTNFERWFKWPSVSVILCISHIVFPCPGLDISDDEHSMLSLFLPG